jgi:hypothetical protein
MTNEVELLRQEIRKLVEDYARGNIPQRTFQKSNEKLTVDLSRLLVQKRLAKGESILAEHHVILAHNKFAGSILRENEQEVIALFVTDRRLFRVRGFQIPNQPLTFENAVFDPIEEIPFNRIRHVTVRRKVRMGQAMVGIAILTVALVFRPWLQITGIALVLLGAFSILHSLLVPTRWAEVLVDKSGVSEPFRVYALRKRTARNLTRMISAKTGTG